MALIRGVGSLFPCPRCLISGVEQGNPSSSAELRTAAGTQATIQEAREQQLAGDKEEILMNAGLQDVDVRLHFFYSCSVLLLITFLTERILEDPQLGPTRRAIFRSAPYLPWRSLPAPPLGTPQKSREGIGQGCMYSG
jgi:hypothetical protein